MNQALPARRLGACALKASSIGQGLMSLSGVCGEPSEANGMAVIHHALDQGISFLDSADMYGWGQNETMAGKAL